MNIVIWQESWSQKNLSNAGQKNKYDFVCLFVLFTLSSSTLRGLVKNLELNGNENKDMNINNNVDYSLVIFWCSQVFQ
jgi:hypothetical protein